MDYLKKTGLEADYEDMFSEFEEDSEGRIKINDVVKKMREDGEIHSHKDVEEKFPGAIIKFLGNGDFEVEGKMDV